MKAWLSVLRPLLIWAGHFFGVYLGASLFPGTDTAHLVVYLLTAVALTAVGLPYLGSVKRHEKIGTDGLVDWMNGLSRTAAAVAAVAIAYQAFTASLS